MRLIDADKLVEDLVKYRDSETSDLDFEIGAVNDCIRTAENQPTAYDVEKVVERLEECINDASKYSEDSTDGYDKLIYTGIESGFYNAIDIVKGGGAE